MYKRQGLDAVVAATVAAVREASGVPVVLGGRGVSDEAHALSLIHI